jgi:hypothetical protein
MILTVDNKGTVDLINNWSCSGRTRHMDAIKLFLREIKEDTILSTIWGPGGENESDVMMKNLQGPVFEKHISKLVGEDEYATVGSTMRITFFSFVFFATISRTAWRQPFLHIY